MFAISSIGKKLLEKLRKKSYRHAYLAEHVRRGIAYQIRALRDQREWNQGKFSKELGKPQSVVSRWEDPSYGKFTVQTLLEIANVYDVALQVRFIPYSTFLVQTRDVATRERQIRPLALKTGQHPTPDETPLDPEDDEDILDPVDEPDIMEEVDEDN